MNSIDIVENMLHHKKYDAVTEFAKIEHPERGTLVITEYAGNIVSAYKDDNGVTKVMIPRSMDLIQEGTVATEIANGTIFDDAEEATNNAEMIEKISIPYNAMINSGKDTPKKLKPMIAIVIGKLDTPEDVGVSDNDRITGNNFVHDLVECNNKTCSVDDVVDNYIGKDKESFHTPEMGHDVADLNKEVSDIRDTKSEDVISDDDTVEDYGGKIPQSGDFDDYLDDDETDDVEDSAEDDKESDDKTESDEKEDLDDDNDESEDDVDDEDDDDIVDEYNVDSSDYDIFMESKQTHFKRTLKKFDYDPKTNTIKTDIDLPDGKKKMRVKLSIDDDVSHAAPPACLTPLIIRDKNGEIADYDLSKYEIHITRKALKSKEWYSAFLLKHEQGHIAYIDVMSIDGTKFLNPEHTDSYKSKGEYARARKFTRENKKEYYELNSHDRSRHELLADKFSAEHTSKKSAVKALDRMYDELQPILRNMSFVTDDEYKEAKKKLKSLKKDMKNDSSTKYKDLTNDINKLVDKQLEVVRKYNDAVKKYLEKHPDTETDYSGRPMRTIPDKEIQKLESQAREIRKNINSLRRKDFTTVIASVEEKLDEMNESVIQAFKGCDFRKKYIEKFVKESVEPELNPNTIRQFDDVYDEDEINAIQEAFFSKKPKKLKPIPRDVVAYITVEMNAISSSNDQAMLSGYTCSKIELVDFYLTVLDTQDPRYIVPHTKQYLETMKRDLENLLTQILRIRPINRNDRIWRVNVNYPEGRM